jgi:uncharacterized protein YndB with AHSA1/START domain
MIRIELQRDIDAPLEDVFARLINIPGYSSWLPHESASLRCTLTSSGPVGVGTTYIDETKAGPMVGEVVELEEPTRVVFRQRLSKLGLPIEEALQTNVLEAIDGGARVDHRFDDKLFGPLRLFEKMGGVRSAAKERNIVFDALKASFEI